MFRTILVPLDGSPFAEQALPWALSIARRARASLELVQAHIVYALKDPTCAWLPYDPAADAECKRQEQLYLDSTAGRLAAVSTRTALVLDLPADSIVARITLGQADLVVMTTHARGPLGRVFLGSVADEVVRRAGVPVLLVRPRDPAPGLLSDPTFQDVLVPLDGSALAEQALGPALELVRLMAGRCTLLRLEPDTVQTEEARAYLERVAGPLRAEGVAVETCVGVSRHPAEAICAQAQGSDLIALATHGRGGLRRLLLGSVAEAVLRHACGPVLVYRPQAE
jgi:nucleotide-binding universal stress UspA family protein